MNQKYSANKYMFNILLFVENSGKNWMRKNMFEIIIIIIINVTILT